MKIKGFWHIAMINNYFDIISEQFKLMKDSGLYDACDVIYAGCLGLPDELKKVSLLFHKTKVVLDIYNSNMNFFEFITLKSLKYYADHSEPFYGFYIHTKGCSYNPPIEGGTYWRDYMNYYILTKWKDDIEKLNGGYDLCGVKLLDEKCAPAYQLHYSGNFFWFKSEYVKSLPLIDSLDIKNRFCAETWIGKANPKAATLCQEFVDYNTKGIFCPPDLCRRICFTLAYNLVSETEKAVKLLYKLNDNFEHYIVDLGFPLEIDKIPKDIEKAQKNNSIKLKALAEKSGSNYLKIDNVGVSQNWTAIYNYTKPKDGDILIGIDPDERPIDQGWIKAMDTIMHDDKTIGICSLMMVDHTTILSRYNKSKTGKINYYEPPIMLNWALIGISGRFFNIIKKVPFPEKAIKYGWIEHELVPLLQKHKLRWIILSDYRVEHTECSTIYRQWKNHILLDKNIEQIDFIEWLRKQIKCDKKKTLKTMKK